MARRTRSNPFISSAIAPFVPWVLGAVVLYFFGDKILASIGAKVAGVDVEQYKEDVATVGRAVVSPIETISDASAAIKLAVGSSLSSLVPASLMAGSIKVGAQAVVIPYPNPQSQAEYRANIAAINAVLTPAGQTAVSNALNPGAGVVG